MKVKRVEAGEPSGDGSQVNDSGDASETEKQKLKKQISELRALISRIEGNLDITRFRNIKRNVSSLVSFCLDHRAATKLPNTNTLFKNDMYRYGGFYCTKADKGEYVFKYAPNDEIRRNETYWIQIFNKDGKGSLGKWVMPMWIDMKQILSETPIENLSNIISLLKNWKLHIDCYAERKSQLCELKTIIFGSSNCIVDANLSFTWITLQLYGMHDATKDIYSNLTVYLSYKQNETRPCKITTEWGSKISLSKEEKELKAYVKCLKNHRLPEGFRLMTETPHPVFTWAIKDHDDSPLELNNTSDSDEETILDRAKLDRKKTRKKRRKRRQKTEETKRRRGKEKAVNSQASTEKENSHYQITLEPPSESSGNRKPKQRQTTINFPSRNAIAPNTEKVTNAEVHKVPDAKPKKTRQAHEPKPVKTVEKESAITKKPGRSVSIGAAKKKTFAKTLRPAITSTPLGTKIAGKGKFAAINDVELSPIASGVEDNNDQK